MVPGGCNLVTLLHLLLVLLKQAECEVTCLEVDKAYIGYAMDNPDTAERYFSDCPSPLHCQMLCQEAEMCEWFNWSNTTHPFPTRCWMKRGKGKAKHMPGVTTGPKYCQQRENRQCIERNRMYIGDGLNMWKRRRNNFGRQRTEGHCQDLCKRMPGCRWFNWDSKSQCWLKKKKGAIVRLEAGTSTGPRECNPLVHWIQGCTEYVASGSQGCGTRLYEDPAQELAHGESSSGEFPWTCLVLNLNNDFIGSCVVIPNDSRNDNNLGTRKILTAAHTLSKIGLHDILKVRVGEYDARGLNLPERIMHEEYEITRLLIHHKFNPWRLSNNLAILYADKEINLNHPRVNTACLPSCSNQFEYQFENGTGIRCWVAGWGKNEFGWKPIQHKVDLPIVGARQCNRALKAALNDHKEGAGDAFNLDESEMCAGGEEGKDACTGAPEMFDPRGDGGSPLVCEAKSGRWTVVGLVTWGIGCASDVPGVYAKLSHFKDWINAY